jgi:hypothetical protein
MVKVIFKAESPLLSVDKKGLDLMGLLNGIRYGFLDWFGFKEFGNQYLLPPSIILNAMNITNVLTATTMVFRIKTSLAIRFISFYLFFKSKFD